MKTTKILLGLLMFSAGAMASDTIEIRSGGTIEAGATMNLGAGTTLKVIGVPLSNYGTIACPENEEDKASFVSPGGGVVVVNHGHTMEHDALYNECIVTGTTKYYRQTGGGKITGYYERVNDAQIREEITDLSEFLSSSDNNVATNTLCLVHDGCSSSNQRIWLENGAQNTLTVNANIANANDNETFQTSYSLGLDGNLLFLGDQSKFTNGDVDCWGGEISVRGGHISNPNQRS